MRRRFSVCTAVLLLGALVAAARADLDVEVGNGAQVTGTLLANESETFRVRLPAGAKLAITATGRRARGGAGLPHVDLLLRGPDDDEVATADIVPTPTGTKLFVQGVPTSGEYRVTLSNTALAGDYRLIVRWTSPKRFQFEGTLAADPVVVPFAADAGAVATFAVRADASTAEPRIVALRDASGAALLDYAAPGPGSARDKRANQRLVDGGDLELVIGDVGAGGAFVATVSVKPPRPQRRNLDLTASHLDFVEDAIGRRVGPLGGHVEFTESVGGILGASVEVPTGALAQATTILIGAGATVDAGGAGVATAGPAVFFGPDGLTFKKGRPVELRIPFDVLSFPGGTSALRVFTRSASGRVSEVTGFTVDGASGFVTFPSAHFSTYQVFVTQTSWDLARDFSDTANPNGAWTYGSSASRGAAFGALPDRISVSGMAGWGDNAGPGYPVTFHNATAGPRTFATAILPAGKVAIHPGPNGENCVIRWTAPVSGDYQVTGAFTGIDASFPTTTDVAVLDGVATLFSGDIATYDVPLPFSLVRTLAAGQSIDFTVGFGANGTHLGDSTSLDATIVLVSAP